MKCSVGQNDIHFDSRVSSIRYAKDNKTYVWFWPHNEEEDEEGEGNSLPAVKLLLWQLLQLDNLDPSWFKETFKYSR